MRTREICFLRPWSEYHDRLLSERLIGGVEVWTLKPNGELICTKGETLRATASFLGVLEISKFNEKQSKASDKTRSQLLAQGWKPLAKNRWCFEREVTTSSPEDKEPTALISMLNDKSQGGAIETEVARQLQDALLELMEKEQAPATKSQIPTAPDIADQLAKLAKLYEDKAITKEEYEAAKRKLLG